LQGNGFKFPDPYSINKSEWISDLSLCPDITVYNNQLQLWRTSQWLRKNDAQNYKERQENLRSAKSPLYPSTSTNTQETSFQEFINLINAEVHASEEAPEAEVHAKTDQPVPSKTSGSKEESE